MSNKAYDVQVDKVLFGDKGFVIQWSGAIGFGEITLYCADNKIMIDAEHMTPDFIKEVFSKLVDKALLK